MSHTRITRPEQCYDVINMSDEMIAEYLQEDGNIILTDPKIIRPICYTVDYIERQMNDPENVFYECHPTTRQVNRERPIVRLAGVSDYYVLVGDLQHAMKEPITWKWMTFEPLEMTGPLMSESARRGGGTSYISALHCQEGSQRQLSTIITFTTDINQPEIQQHQTPEETDTRVQSVRQGVLEEERVAYEAYERQERQRVERQRNQQVERQRVERLQTQLQRQAQWLRDNHEALENTKFILSYNDEDARDTLIWTIGTLPELIQIVTRHLDYEPSVHDMLDGDEIPEFSISLWRPPTPNVFVDFDLSVLQGNFILIDVLVAGDGYGFSTKTYDFDNIESANTLYNEINGGSELHHLHLYEVIDGREIRLIAENTNQ
jgi:hypothetical protein